ncbi:MAG: aminoacyl-tRNA hydrolase [Clostridia bacterium]|nr:aminoacyl-tRNA hydrolase [Clostridia bacterium]
MYLIIGLGNPGRKYDNTRHNVGFAVIDKISEKLNIQVDKKQAQSLVQSSFWRGKKVLLVKPQTYMNLSGQAALELINFYHDQIEDLLVIHDDLDLPVGQLRFKREGGSGGHNGLKSIIKCLNSQDFNRLKIGIGRPPEYIDVVDYVLTSFTKEEEKILSQTIRRAVDGIEEWLENGIDSAMNLYNKKVEIE